MFKRTYFDGQIICFLFDNHEPVLFRALEIEGLRPIGGYVGGGYVIKIDKKYN